MIQLAWKAQRQNTLKMNHEDSCSPSFNFQVTVKLEVLRLIKKTSLVYLQFLQTYLQNMIRAMRTTVKSLPSLISFSLRGSQ
jgi:hypothetical protein